MMHTRRGILGIFAGAMASTAVPALMWHTSQWNYDRIARELALRLDAEEIGHYTPAEVEKHKAHGGWGYA